MKVVKFIPGMQITNVDQLSKGTGSKYLEVLDYGEGPFIAVQWRKTKPNKLDSKYRILIQFK